MDRRHRMQRLRSAWLSLLDLSTVFLCALAATWIALSYRGGTYTNYISQTEKWIIVGLQSFVGYDVRT